MPLVTVHTSAPPPNEAQTQSLLRELSSTVARLLGKPEKYLMTCLAPGAPMTFGGSPEPSAAVEIQSIGGLTFESGRRLSEAVCKIVHEKLGVPTARIYVVCADVPPHLWGFDGSTFG